MQLLEDLGYVVVNRVDRKSRAPDRSLGCQRFVFINKRKRFARSCYCAIKNHDQVQLDFVGRVHRIKSGKNWIDLKNPDSIELIRRRVRKLNNSNGF